MKFLVIGCGSIGKRHIGNLSTLGGHELSAFDPDPGRLAEVSSKFGAKTFSDLAAALKAKPDAVFVCSPNNLHLRQARLAAEAGCDLFIEKPLSHDLAGIEELIAVVERKKLRFFMGSNFKFHPAFRKMKAVIAEKLIGKVLSFTVIFGQYLPDWHPWEDYRRGYSANRRLGGGILLDSHEFDYLQWLLGPIDKVAAFCGKLTDLEIDTEDIAEVIVKLKSGAIGSVHLDYLQRPYRRSYYFYGDRGSLEWEFNANEVKVYTTEKKEWEIMKIDPAYDLNQMYLEEARHFINVLMGKEASLSTIEEAVRVLRVIAAAKESSSVGKTVTV
jgi:predicted dehydrogenase